MKNGSIKASISSAAPIYCSTLMQDGAPKDILNDLPVNPRVAKQIIEDELNLDGNPSLNMASFVTTWMEQEAEDLMVLGMRKNFIDLDEYGQTAEIHNRCVKILANLYNAPPTAENIPHPGTGCVGSSEAIMLSGLAMKWRWKKRRQEAGLPCDKPNIVFGANVQVCM